MSKHDLMTADDAAEILRIDAAEVAELLKTGELRKIWHRAGNDSEAPLDCFVMGSDVRRLQQQEDPRYLAKVAAGEIIEPDESGDTPRSLAAGVPRF